MKVNDKELLKYSNELSIKENKEIIYNAYKDYKKDEDIYYSYFINNLTYNVKELSVPQCHAIIKILMDKDSLNFKNTSLENNTIEKLIDRIKVIYDINTLMANKINNNAFFTIMDKHSWYDRDYISHLKYKEDNKINVEKELLHINDADFLYLCTILTMLLRENNYDNSWLNIRIPSGIIDKILTKMAYLIVIGEYTDIKRL